VRKASKPIGLLNMSGKPLTPTIGLYTQKEAFNRFEQGLPVSIITKTKTSRVLRFNKLQVITISNKQVNYKYVLGYC
jgi:hypothetical protein